MFKLRAARVSHTLKDNSLFVNDVIRKIHLVTLVGRVDRRTYSSGGAMLNNADLAFLISGRATDVMNCNHFSLLARLVANESGVDDLLIEPVSDVLVGRSYFGGKATYEAKLFGPATETAKTGKCAKHGINYGWFTVRDGEYIRECINDYFGREAVKLEDDSLSLQS